MALGRPSEIPSSCLASLQGTGLGHGAALDAVDAAAAARRPAAAVAGVLSVFEHLQTLNGHVGLSMCCVGISALYTLLFK